VLVRRGRGTGSDNYFFIFTFLLSTHSVGDPPSGVGDITPEDLSFEFTFLMC